MTGKKYAKPTSDALEILDRLFYDGRPDRQEALKQARRRGDVAEEIYNMRKDAGLTQKELAERVGTTPSVISRLEDADYGKHSLRMLRSVAAALGRSVEVEFPEIAPSPNPWHDQDQETGAQTEPLSLWQEFVRESSDAHAGTAVENDDLSIAA